jgi:hypothetical protein
MPWQGLVLVLVLVLRVLLVPRCPCLCGEALPKNAPEGARQACIHHGEELRVR